MNIEVMIKEAKRLDKAIIDILRIIEERLSRDELRREIEKIAASSMYTPAEVAEWIYSEISKKVNKGMQVDQIIHSTLSSQDVGYIMQVRLNYIM